MLKISFCGLTIPRILPNIVAFYHCYAMVIFFSKGIESLFIIRTTEQFY